jgi:hypothetical protein
MTDSPSLARQQWLERATAALRNRFARLGYTVPAEVRVSIGWPRGSHGGQRAIGQCWGVEASSDKHNEIFISPELRDSTRIIGVLAHELVHATVGVKAGHKKPFKQCALAIGLTGKMTSTNESAEFLGWAAGVINKLGMYPAGSISDAKRKKQTTRLLKCECGECGYVVRVAKSWAEIGLPICPTDNQPMICDAIGGDDE